MKKSRNLFPTNNLYNFRGLSNIFKSELLWLIVFSPLIAGTCVSCSNSKFDLKIISELDSLLESQDYFKFKSLYEAQQNKLPEINRKIFKSYIDLAFNQKQKCNFKIEELLKVGSLSHREKYHIHNLLLEQSKKQNQYKKARSECTIILANYTDLLDAEKIKDLQKLEKKMEALSEVPKPEYFIHSDSQIPLIQDHISLWNIPVVFDEDEIEFLLDTGCGRSVISNSIARKYKLNFLNFKHSIMGTNGDTLSTNLAVAPEFRVGNISLHNIVFEVLEDSLLGVPEYEYYINGILGIDILSQFREIQILENKTLYIPANPQKYTCQNLSLLNSIPLILAQKDEDSLLLKIDTGAAMSMMFKPFYDKYKEEIDANNSPFITEYGGLGGSKSYAVYFLDSLVLNIADKSMKMCDICTHTGLTIANSPRKYHGIFGLDQIRSYNEMILSYEYNSVVFK